MKNALIFILLVTVAIGAGIYFFSPEFNAQRLSRDTYTGEAQIGGGFTLTDQNGKPRSDAEFRGKYMLVFFGFTNCPSICPPGMMNMTQAMESLGEANKNIVPIFITVDPERDTPERMKEFLSNFYPSFIGLTGKPEDAKAVESAYKVYSSKVEAKDQPDGYMMDHSGFIYLMDRNGKYLTHFTYDAEPKKLVSGIKEAIN